MERAERRGAAGPGRTQGPPAAGVLPGIQADERRYGMSVVEAVRAALQALASNRMRTALTMLGIIIGVAAVIVTVAIGEGAARDAQQAIQRLGTNRLYIRPESRDSRGVNQGADSGISLRLEDAEIVRKSSRYIVEAAPEYRGSGRIKYRNLNDLTEINGSTPEIFRVRNLPIAHGRSFTHAEVKSRARVAVLGHEVWQKLFGGRSPLGATIRINSQPFVVVGVQKKQGAVPFANRDDQITIPITTAMRRLFAADRIRSISAQVVSAEKMKEAEDEVLGILRRAHKLRPGQASDIRVHNQADLMETAAEQSAVLTMLLAGIAVVSLIVGGIGIMNIMLVSVTERTREIGIRKAIGAKRKHILYQFLIESIMLSLTGGALGIALGVGVSAWMGRPADAGGPGFPMLVTSTPLLLSFCSSALVGVFFGIMPAIKAAAVNPIEALRYE